MQRTYAAEKSNLFKAIFAAYFLIYGAPVKPARSRW
jgi:hypothetical protein